MMVIKDRTCRSDIIVYFDVNLKLLTKLMNSAFVCVWTTWIYRTLCRIRFRSIRYGDSKV